MEPTSVGQDVRAIRAQWTKCMVPVIYSAAPDSLDSGGATGQAGTPESSGVAARPLGGEDGAPGRTHNSFRGNRGEEAEGVPVMRVGRGAP